MQTKAKELYPMLFEKNWPDPLEFLADVANNPNNQIWGGGGAGREFSREILARDKKWIWLAERVDDFAILVEENMRNKLHKWIFRAELGLGALSKRLCSTESTVKWLLDRYVAELKNLFDERYKNYINLKAVYLIQLHEDHVSAATETWQNCDPSEESTLKVYHTAESSKYE